MPTASSMLAKATRACRKVLRIRLVLVLILTRILIIPMILDTNHDNHSSKNNNNTTNSKIVAVHRPDGPTREDASRLWAWEWLWFKTPSRWSRDGHPNSLLRRPFQGFHKVLGFMV